MKKTKMTPTFKIAKKRMIASKKAPARRMKARAAKEKKRIYIYIYVYIYIYIYI